MLSYLGNTFVMVLAAWLGFFLFALARLLAGYISFVIYSLVYALWMYASYFGWACAYAVWCYGSLLVCGLFELTTGLNVRFRKSGKLFLTRCRKPSGSTVN
jgi:hypothetical protein